MCTFVLHSNDGDVNSLLFFDFNISDLSYLFRLIGIIFTALFSTIFSFFPLSGGVEEFFRGGGVQNYGEWFSFVF